ncbi:MAG: 2,5-diamino-6-(ribosylamino)-4(3H)-pyrimidinone 5'-phosphate reductase [Archaeoglobi archaeon]|nr:2,5-diamino-6-(ribosylamino)-4(3H)-pyrimidinone 5'-phosphate reductase [Candidatus Mnemosynella sp.]
MKPYVIVNSAMSMDGKISTVERVQTRISSEWDRKRVDALRASADAIMVGIGTVLSDDPSLTVKSEKLRRKRISEGMDENPLRVVVDSKLRIPENAEILQKGAGKRLIFTTSLAPKEKIDKISRFAEVLIAGEERVDLRRAMEELHRRGVRRVLVEGGGTLIFSLLRENLVDEISVYIGNFVIGGESAPTLADGEGFTENFPRFHLSSIITDSEGVLLRWIRR